MRRLAGRGIVSLYQNVGWKVKTLACLGPTFTSLAGNCFTVSWLTLSIPSPPVELTTTLQIQYRVSLVCILYKYLKYKASYLDRERKTYFTLSAMFGRLVTLSVCSVVAKLMARR